ncbi:hypothetical protein ACS0TY_001065 [Phlomoides rotata]
MKGASSQCLAVIFQTILSPILLIAFIFSAALFYSADFCYISRFYDNRPATADEKIGEKHKVGFAMGEGNYKDCDVFSGRWVRDYSRPLYEEWQCPYIGDQLTCLNHGRPEMDYRYWRWQPRACYLPSFNATLMLEALRGKRLMFVGDSLNRGQFTSLVCLVQRVLPQHAKSIQTFGSLTVFTAKDYNARIEYYWSPFLLESNSDDPNKHRIKDRIIRNGTVDKHGQHWKKADILIFNSYIWWVEGVRIVQDWSEEVKNIKNISTEDGYRIAMKMLVKWINKNRDPKKTTTFYSGMSATHQASERWGGSPKGNCFNETKMLEDQTFFAARTSLLHIINEELGKSAVPVTLLNITQLTSPRKDAHTSIYKKFFEGPLTQDQKANGTRYADCIHWCLPGVQDVWNELLYAKLLFFP